MMHSTLLRLLKKSKTKTDPLLGQLNPTQTDYNDDLSPPNNMNGININYEIQLTVPENMKGLNKDIEGLKFPKRIEIEKDEHILNLDPPRTKQDPLLKILTPNDNENIDGLDVPNKTLEDHLENLKGHSLPNDIVLDTIQIEIVDNDHGSARGAPSKFERIRITQHPNDPLDKQLREFPTSDDYDEFGEAPEEHQNPLLRLLDTRTNFDENILSAPKYRQNPLLRQLQKHPEQFRNDFLELPHKKQDTLLKILRQSGESSFDIDKLVPPDYKQNPLLRLLQPGPVS